VHQWFFDSRLLKVAAVLLIVIISSWILIQNTNSFQIQMEEIIVKNSEIKDLILADGSKISLDAGSSFRYPAKFENGKREVFLNGEGYFEVESNPENPFIIHANDAVITVLGTKFNVRSWLENKNTIVAVRDGRVSLKPEYMKNSTANVIISSSQMSELRANENPDSPIEVDLNNHISWMNREIYMKNIPLRDVLNQLERWYDVKISVSEETYESNLVTIFIQNKPIEDILNVIALMNNFEYEISGNEITFFSQPTNVN